MYMFFKSIPTVELTQDHKNILTTDVRNTCVHEGVVPCLRFERPNMCRCSSLELEKGIDLNQQVQCSGRASRVRKWPLFSNREKNGHFLSFSSVNPFLTCDPFVTPWGPISTLTLNKSAKSWIQTTCDGTIRFSIKIWIQMHWLILKNIWFWQVLWPQQKNKVGEPWLTSGQTWQKRPFSQSVDGFFYHLMEKTEPRSNFEYDYLSGCRKKWMLEVSVKVYNITSDWIIDKNLSNSKKFTTTVFQNETKKIQRYPVTWDFSTDFNAVLTRRSPVQCSN